MASKSTVLYLQGNLVKTKIPDANISYVIDDPNGLITFYNLSDAEIKNFPIILNKLNTVSNSPITLVGIKVFFTNSSGQKNLNPTPIPGLFESLKAVIANSEIKTLIDPITSTNLFHTPFVNGFPSNGSAKTPLPLLSDLVDAISQYNPQVGDTTKYTKTYTLIFDPEIPSDIAPLPRSIVDTLNNNGTQQFAIFLNNINGKSTQELTDNFNTILGNLRASNNAFDAPGQQVRIARMQLLNSLIDAPTNDLRNSTFNNLSQSVGNANSSGARWTIPAGRWGGVQIRNDSRSAIPDVQLSRSDPQLSGVPDEQREYEIVKS